MKQLVWFVMSFLLLACDNQDNMLYMSTACGVDAPAKNQEFLIEQAFTISGWAFDEFSENTPEHIRVKLTSTNGQVNLTLVGRRGIERPDIAQLFKKPDALMSGFIVPVSSNSLSPGKYKMVVEQTTKHYQLTCNPNTDFFIKAGQQ